MAETASLPRLSLAAGMTVQLLPRQSYLVRYTPADYILGFAFESQSGIYAFDSDRARPFRTLPNGMACTPPGCSIYSEAPTGGEYLLLAARPDALADLRREEEGPLPTEHFSDRILEQGVRAAHALRRCILGSLRHEPVDLESSTAAFVDACLDAGKRTEPGPRLAGSLTRKRLTIVEDLIESRLGEALPVTDMAAAIGLSTGFFLRTFHAATGQTPHRFLLARRIARARNLLETTGTDAAHIAYLCGFSSQAHLTSTFQRQLGITPAAYRATYSRRRRAGQASGTST